MKWLIAFHIIFIVAWFSALFYLPRLFVYHAECKDEISNERFKIMERRLFYGIMLPSTILTSISGFWLLNLYERTAPLHQWWLHIKLWLVLLLYIYMIFCWKYLQDFKHNRNKHHHVFYRWFNEFPSLILVIVVILAVVQPF